MGDTPLKIMGMDYNTAEKPQILAEYNQDLNAGNDEIENGDFITAIDLKKEVSKW
jgi:hypothetical protein